MKLNIRHKDYIQLLPQRAYRLNWQLRKLLVVAGGGEEIFGIWETYHLMSNVKCKEKTLPAH